MEEQSILLSVEGDGASADETLAGLEAGASGVEESMAALSAALEATNSLLETLAETLAGVATGLDDLAAAVQDNSVALNENTASLDENTTALDENAAAAETNAGAHDTANASMDAFGKNAKKMIMPLTLATAAVAGIGIVSLKMAGDFQSGITSLVTGAGEAQGNIKMVSDGIQQMAVQTGESTGQLIAGAYMIESAGYHGKQALDVLRAAAEGAKVGAADLGTVADATTTILNDFGNTGVNATQAVNYLVATVASGKTHMQDLAGALAQILPTASAASVSLRDVMGAMATMTGEGVPAANAATYLRQTLLALEAPTKQTKDALAAVGLSTAQVADAMHKSLPDALKMITDHLSKKFPEGSAAYVAALKSVAGGAKQLQGFLDLTGQHMGTFQGDVAGITGAVKQGGASITGWALVQQDFNQKMSQAGATLEVMFQRLGTALMPVATAFVGHIMPAFQAFSEWVTTHGQQAAQLFGVLAGVLGGALVTALGAVAIAEIAAAAPMLPFIALGGAIAGVIALLVTHWQQVTTALQPAVTWFGNLFGAVHKVSEPFQTFKMVTLEVHGHIEHVRVAVEGVKTAFDHVKGPLTPVADLFQRISQGAGALTSAIGALIPHQQQVTEHYQRWQTVLTHVHGHLVAHKELIEGTRTAMASFPGILPQLEVAFGKVGTALSYLKPLWTELQSQFGPILKQLGDTVNTSLKPAWTELVQAFNTAKPALVLLGEVIGGIVVVDLGFLIAMLKGTINALGQVIQGTIMFVGGLIAVVAGFVKLFVDYWSGLFSMLKDIFTGNWSQLGKDAHTFFTNMVTDLGNIGKGLWQMLQGLFKVGIQSVLGFVTGFVTGVIGFFTHLWEQLVGHSIIPDLINGIITWFASLPGKVLGLVSGLVGGVIGHFTRLATNGVTAIQHLATGAVAHARDMAAGFLAHVVHLATGTDHHLQLMKDQAAMHADQMKLALLTRAEQTHLQAAAHYASMRQRILAELAQTKDGAKRHALEQQLALVNAAERTQVEAARHAEEQKKQTLAHYKQMAADAKTQSQHLHDGVLGVLSTLPGNALSAISSLASNFTSFFGNLASQMLTAGRGVVQGLINGIQGMAGGAMNAIQNVGSGMLGGLKSILGIHSPSTVFAAVGKNLSQGIVQGFQSVDLGNALTSHMQTALATLRGGLGRGLSGGGLGVPGGLPAGGGGLGVAGAGGALGTAALTAVLGQLAGALSGARVGASPTTTATGTVTQQFGSANFYGVNDLNALWNALNQLGGLAQENGVRGAVAGLGL